MYDLRLIQHFEAVYRLQSFSRAADELHLTHSALTKSIQTLESLWGTRLLHRTTRSVVPSEAGERLYPLAIELLSFSETVRQEAIGGERTLNVVCGPAVLETLLHSAIAKFRQRYPKTRVRAETKPPLQAIEDVLQRRAHLLLYHRDTLRGLPQLKQLCPNELLREPYTLICRPGHPVLKSRRTIKAVLSHDWAIAGYDDQFAANLSPEKRSLFEEHDFPKYRLLSQHACIELVKQSDVLSSVPKSTADILVAEGLVDGFEQPGGFEFSIVGASLIDVAPEPTVAHFMECIGTIEGYSQTSERSFQPK